MTLDTLTPSNPKQKTKQIKVAPFTAPAKNPKTISKVIVLMWERNRPQILPMILSNLTPKKWRAEASACSCWQTSAALCHATMSLPVPKTKLPNESLLALSGCMGCGPAQMLTSTAMDTPFLCVWRTKINKALCNRARCEIPTMTHLHRGKVRLKIRTSLNNSGNALEPKKKRA